MAYRLSRRAEEDLLEIGVYTLLTWGEGQAARYLATLELACETLTRRPYAQACEELGAGLHRVQVPGSKHLIFFLIEEDGAAFVVRILHEQMDLAAHLADEWEE